MPQWQAVEAENLKRLADNLSFLDVAGCSDAMRLLIRFYGTEIYWVYGVNDQPVIRLLSGIHKMQSSECIVPSAEDR